MVFTHSQRLERWLGQEQLDILVGQMAGWYGPPIPVANVPGFGPILAHKGGEFTGKIVGGHEMSLADYVYDEAKERVKLFRSNLRRASSEQDKEKGLYAHMALSSLADLINAATTGGRRAFQFQKAGTTGVAGITSSLWRVGAQPSAGGAASAAPGGNIPVDSTAGAFPFDNPAGGTTQRLVSAWPQCSTAGNTLLLYDRIFEVAKTMSSSATEAVTGVPTRYTNTTAGTEDSAEGNFLFVDVQAALGATAHNWTVCQYTNQAGTTTKTLPSLTGVASAIINRQDTTLSTWFAPLAAGDTGMKALTQMQCSAVVTGTIAFVMGHPLAWFPLPLANQPIVYDGLNTSFNLIRIFDDAALAFLEICKPSTTATNYWGEFLTLRG